MKKGGERQLISPLDTYSGLSGCLLAELPAAACRASAGLQLPAESKPLPNFSVLLLLFHPLTRLTPSLLLVPVFTSPSTGTPRLALSCTQISLPFASSRLPQPIPTWPPCPPAPAPSLSKTSQRLQRRPDTPPPPPQILSQSPSPSTRLPSKTGVGLRLCPITQTIPSKLPLQMFLSTFFKYPSFFSFLF